MSRMGLEPRAWSRRRVMLGRVRRQRKRASHPSPNWAKRVVKRNGRAVELITLDEFGPTPPELVLHNGTPDSIAGWKALADGLLTDQPCVFHRNLEISSRLRLDVQGPACVLQVGRDGGIRVLPRPAGTLGHSGWTLIAAATWTSRSSIDRHRPHPGGLLAVDVDTIRATNNAIFDDIFWVHLAYSSVEDGIGCLRALLGTEPRYAALLTGFEAIDRRTSCVGERDGLRDGSTDG